jgi:hypothetical protein
MPVRNLGLAAIALVLGGAGRGAPPSPPEIDGIPWLHNLASVRVTDEETTGRLVLVADAMKGRGHETVVASYTSGILVLDREGQTIGSAPGYTFHGSADEITALAVGTAFGEPTIALAITRGGHREQWTDLALYREDVSGQLDAVFTAEVEHRDGDTVEQGAVWLIPGGLIYRHPEGATALWTFDRVGGVYLYRGGFALREMPPHAEPPPMM